jgi:hypothetical protein
MSAFKSTNQVLESESDNGNQDQSEIITFRNLNAM